jgi:hypothetical protein
MEKRRPKVLDDRQLELVAVICDLIIPETTTPGARSVGVPEYIDFTLGRASGDAQRRFLNGLEWIGRESERRFGQSFVYLASEQQIALLQRIELAPSHEDEDRIGAAFFGDIKNRTIYAYYNSKAGIFQELGYQGNTPLADFPGCDHPEHLRRGPR